MNIIDSIINKPSVLAIGLMSGTSADGMDAALMEIAGSGPETKVRELAFVSLPYSKQVRDAILRLAEGQSGGMREACLFSFLLGELSLEACLAVCKQAGAAPGEIDFVGSHGQTLYHIPAAEQYLGRRIRGTLQLGEASVICQGMGCPVVSDFRVRDMAAGGNGAPLVPYTEYLLFSSASETVGLQNLGGIGNLTVLPRGGRLEDTFAFDTGPGNMVIDALAQRMTDGRQRFDDGGRLAQSGAVSGALLAFMLDDPYLDQRPPKTTGREYYGQAYVERLCRKAESLGVSPAGQIATATRFTAECVRAGIEQLCPTRPDRLVIGGGGSRNPAMMAAFREVLGIPVLTQEDMGHNSESKEAVAFAILANECLHGICNNVPAVTGAAHPVVMGKISL